MTTDGGGWVVRRFWVIFQCRGVLLIWIIVGQGPVALAVGAGGGCLDIFSLIYPFSPLSPSLWETARYRLKYCFRGPLNPKQPTNMTTVTYVTASETSTIRWAPEEARSLHSIRYEMVSGPPNVSTSAEAARPDK